MSALVTKDERIIDLMKKHPTAFTSLEFFPPRTAEGVENLRKRIVRMKKNCMPVFMDVTWGAGGSTSELTMDLVRFIKSEGCVANMHLTCTNMDPLKVKEALSDARKYGITNIVALRGDAPNGDDEWKAAEGGFKCALDLVKFIRKEFGNEFGISVAGYPEGHPNAISVIEEGGEKELTEKEKLRCSTTKDPLTSKSKTCVCYDADYASEMDYLKAKVSAGADFVITQMFFDAEVFKTFVADCREWGIDVPIVPGIMCINNYGGFFRMTGFCKTRVPQSVVTKMEAIKNDDAALKEYGIKFGTEMCMSLVQQGAPCVHFYTLNLEKVVYGILDGLGWTTELSRSIEDADKDEKTMRAVGSKWARAGDEVISMFGKGVVKEISWKLAFGQEPTAVLQAGTFKKV
ncbi:hypothetical protein TrRE_jg1648 [Triparma retinervis]|uniref:Methylenetetrahydrofolate reductase (NAD(P)H) n=1 Tax=Triparma retinervis TaxID=2557542 RepID=A0A9W6ZNP6_9STRA|nr:hypothetical protein TrRE_jg1648 [Triparma retinervis]